jgi:hypothetical protein
MTKETEVSKNTIHIEFEADGSIGLSAMHVSPNVSPLQVLAIADYLRISAETLIRANLQNQAIIEEQNKILTPNK